MKTVTAADANRKFSSLLRSAAEGEEVLVLSRGRPAARIVPAQGAPARRKRARATLLRRLKEQTASGRRTWRRDKLYER
jgi:prevent-host-death family protein